MYGKLIWQNVKRSLSDYIIYIVTLTLSVAMFYSFLSVSSQYYNPDIGSQYNINHLSSGMKLAIVGITFVIIFLVSYVNKYMIKRRQKEFGVQTMIGMEQNTLAWFFFFETLMMGGIALGIGIFLGVFISQLISGLLLTTLDQPFRIIWTLYPDTCLYTVGLFLVIYILIGLFHVRTIRRIKIIQMLRADRENEELHKRNLWIPGIVIAFSFALIWILKVSIWFYQESYIGSMDQIPRYLKINIWINILLPVMMLVTLMVWAIIQLIKRKLKWKILLVLYVIGTVLLMVSHASFILFRKEYLAQGHEIAKFYLNFIGMEISFIICMAFALISDIFQKVKEHSLNIKYYQDNLFFFGQISSKIRSAMKTMSLICLTLTFSISMFMGLAVMVQWAEGYLETRALYEVQISSSTNDVESEEDLRLEDLSFVTRFLNDKGIQVKDKCDFQMYLPKRSEFEIIKQKNSPILAISLSDYNHIRSLVGIDAIVLGGDECAVQWSPLATTEQKEAFVRDYPAIDTDQGGLKVSEQRFYEDLLGETLYTFYTDALYVFPDSKCENLLPITQYEFIQTEEPLTYDVAEELTDVFDEFTSESSPLRYQMRTKTIQRSDAMTGVFLMRSSMTYAAVVLLIICFTILALQQLMDASVYRYRFNILRKLGVSEQRIRILLIKQVGIWFSIPLMIAALMSAIFTTCMIKAISVQFDAYIRKSELWTQILMIIVVLIILFLCYFVSAFVMLQKVVDSKK